jgi:hypothetical protein
MKKFQLLGLALFAVLAVGAAAATSSALALESVWLVNGNRLFSLELVLSETIGNKGDNSGEILLEDSKAPLVGKTDVTCSGFDEGWVGTGSLDEITLIMSLGTTETAEGWIACKISVGCEAGTTPEAMALNLPWLTELLLTLSGTEEIFLDDIVAGTGEAGWLIRNCLVLGAPREDECTTNQASVDIDNNVTQGDVVALFLGAASNVLAHCSQSGTNSGIVEGEVLIDTVSGLSLAVSEG